MSKVFIPGSFDPIHLGHVKVIRLSIDMFGYENVIVGIGNNPSKQYMFSVEERTNFIKQIIEVKEIVQYNGSTVLAGIENKCNIIIKGIRNSADFESEMQMAEINELIVGNLDDYEDNYYEIQTLLLPIWNFTHCSSTNAKELVRLGQFKAADCIVGMHNVTEAIAKVYNINIPV